MERARPRVGSVCLPAGHEWVRLVLVPLALVAGVWVGMEVLAESKVTAEAIAAGVLAADIALHVVELLVHALAFSRWAWVIAVELLVGTVAGLAFFRAFEHTGEAVAVGLMTANIALHIAEAVIEPIVRKHERPKPAGEDEPHFTDPTGGFGGPAAATGAA
ncbi:hypothetical protein ABZ759_30480 [Streptomyces sp. NPDC047860]|uniref:hypothetical protein n=1 Tax=Streptomyces sp. NPDC047860 TaxID=3155743 RepID=UPI00340215C0